MNKTVAMLGLSLWIGSAAAGDQAEFRSLGFSESGRYYAFAQVGTQDGSGFPYADVAVVDVLKNDLMTVKSVAIQDEAQGKVEDALRQAIAQIKLDRYGIKKDAELGLDLLWRDSAAATDPAEPLRFSFEEPGHGGATEGVPYYEVVVEETKVSAPKDEPFCEDLGGPKLLKLSLVGREETDGSTQVLQADKRLPKSRACPLEYGVRGVTAYAGGVVVVVAYTRPGFEGPDTRYLVVSGKAGPQP